MARNTDSGLLILRVGMSGMMLSHGIPKLMKLFSGNMEFADPIGIGAAASLILAVIGEAICPMLIILGVKTRLAAIPVIITMFVAGFIYHAKDDIGTKEKAILYLIGFIAIGLMGAGKLSIDRK